MTGNGQAGSYRDFRIADNPLAILSNRVANWITSTESALIMTYRDLNKAPGQGNLTLTSNGRPSAKQISSFFSAASRDLLKPIASARSAPRRDLRNTVFRGRPCRCGTP